MIRCWMEIGVSLSDAKDCSSSIRCFREFFSIIMAMTGGGDEEEEGNLMVQRVKRERKGKEAR